MAAHPLYICIYPPVSEAEVHYARSTPYSASPPSSLNARSRSRNLLLSEGVKSLGKVRFNYLRRWNGGTHGKPEKLVIGK